MGNFTGEPMGPVGVPLGESKRLLVSMDGANLHLEDEELSGCCREEQYWLFCFTLRHTWFTKLRILLEWSMRARSQAWNKFG